MAQNDSPLSAASLRPYLRQCGYGDDLLRTHYSYVNRDAVGSVQLAAFAHEPSDARSICLIADDCSLDPSRLDGQYRMSGAPVVFLCHNDRLHWWAQRSHGLEKVEVISGSEIANFFAAHESDLAPNRIYTAKTRGRFERAKQLDFVDAGLMPLVEAEVGKRISGLVEGVIHQVVQALSSNAHLSSAKGRWIFQAVFWMLAAKILKDKNVPAFADISFSDPESVFDRVGRHYNATPIVVPDRQAASALVSAASAVGGFIHLGNVTTESLAFVYENALISKETRAKLGTHSTPAYLVDYIVWQLAPWIEEIDPEQRHVFEPACGHAAFLVSAMRLLRELYPSPQQHQERMQYLRQRLHGIEVDDFAREIARLSLTLADIPNPNNWDLRKGDMFEARELEKYGASSQILLANPPFEKFDKTEQRHYKRHGVWPTYYYKADEMLRRVVPTLQPGRVFGIVVPQGLLQSAETAKLRQFLLQSFDLAEICLFPDGIFAFSDAETAVLIGRRRREGAAPAGWLQYRQVREKGAEAFKLNYRVQRDERIEQELLLAQPKHRMWIPELRDLWGSFPARGRLHEIATVGRGIEYRSTKDASPAHTFSKKWFQGGKIGFARLHPHLLIHRLPENYYLSLNKKAIQNPRSGKEEGTPQILLNYARVDRGPWRLKAFIDRGGHPIRNSFTAIRPRATSTPLEYLWALLNSPLANAFVYAHSLKRHVLEGTVRAIPVPNTTKEQTARISSLVKLYFQVAAAYDMKVNGEPENGDNLFKSPKQILLLAKENLLDPKRLLMTIDAAVLQLYNLRPEFEIRLLQLFAGEQRAGVGFEFTEYAESENVHFPLWLSLSLERFHELVDKQLRGTIQKRERTELQTLEDAFDATEADTDRNNQWLAGIERKQAESLSRVEELERILQDVETQNARKS